ncbi:MAG TPA: pitrilysin family protein [Bauldia sp.]|nr:pitrilysin family protein [Bauldia sp.]
MKLTGTAVAIGLFVSLVMAEGAEAIEIERVVSPKGIEAWLVEEHTVPVIAVSFAFKGGSAQDPEGKAGVANMLSGLLDEGAGPLDSRAFQAALDAYSIGLSFDASRDTFSGSLRTLSEHRDEAVRLARLALTQPRFDAEPVERIRSQIITGIKASERDPGEIASRAMMEAVFGAHPYGVPSEGTVESVTSITADDLRAWHRKLIARDNLEVAVVGDIDAETLAPMLDEIFGELPLKANRIGIPDLAPRQAKAIDVPMTIPQAIIQIAGNGLKRDDPDFIAASVASYILGGGGFSSRLYKEIREKRGLAYSVWLGLIPLDHAGLWFVSTSTRADQAGTVVALIEDEIARFAEEGPTEQELADAKAYLIGSYPLRFDTSGAISDQLLAIQLEDLGIDYVNRRNDLIAAITIEDIRRVSKRLFEGEDRVVVRVGAPET